MEEIINLLTSDPKKVVEIIKSDSNSKDKGEVEKLRDEYKKLDRKSRESQIGKIQKDKIVGEGESAKTVRALKIQIPFQNRIVTLSTGFEVGEPVTISAEKQSALSDEILRLWKINRLDSKLQKLKEIQKSETEAAIIFYISNLKPKTLLNRLLGANKNKDIKSRVLDQSKGKFYPYFDAMGDMTLFMWEFSEKGTSKTINNVWIYDSTKIYKMSDVNNGMQMISVEEHGFDRIPAVYMDQDYPEWWNVQSMIDRLEVSMSKLGGSNDRTAHPIIKLYGEILSAPDPEDDGKALHFPMKEKRDGTGGVVHGDAEYLVNSNAPESSKLELDKLEDYIYSLSQTPNLSFDNLKGLGNVSGVALKLMFLDAILKAKLNEGQNRTIIERMLNIMTGGTITTTVIKYKSDSSDMLFNIQFNSILPDDLKTTVETLAAGVNANIISKKTSVEALDLTEDSELELSRLKEEVQPKV